jgi:hypothetical protein
MRSSARLRSLRRNTSSSVEEARVTFALFMADTFLDRFMSHAHGVAAVCRRGPVPYHLSEPASKRPLIVRGRFQMVRGTPITRYFSRERALHMAVARISAESTGLIVLVWLKRLECGWGYGGLLASFGTLQPGVFRVDGTPRHVCDNFRHNLSQIGLDLARFPSIRRKDGR